MRRTSKGYSMPILDASALDQDLAGSERLRALLGSPRMAPTGRRAMREAVSTSRKTTVVIINETAPTSVRAEKSLVAR
jgi:hypothetical protein